MATISVDMVAVLITNHIQKAAKSIVLFCNLNRAISPCHMLFLDGADESAVQSRVDTTVVKSQDPPIAQYRDKSPEAQEQFWPSVDRLTRQWPVEARAESAAQRWIGIGPVLADPEINTHSRSTTYLVFGFTTKHYCLWVILHCN